MTAKKKSKTEAKSNEKVEKETFEMDLGVKPGNDKDAPESSEPKDIDVLKEKFPDKGEKELETLLKEMPLKDAIFILGEEKDLPQQKEERTESVPETVAQPNNNLEPEVKIMENVNEPETTQEMSVEQELQMLMQEQDSMQKELEAMKGGVVTVDDTVERADRATKIAVEGKRRGAKFNPSKGTALFMVKQNAKYKASGRPAPYSKECIEATLKRERA